MRTTFQTCTLAALLATALAPQPSVAQERRDSTRGAAAATSAEEMHRIRRAWLEQRRMGALDRPAPMFGSAVVGAPRAGTATGIGGPIRAGVPPIGYREPFAAGGVGRATGYGGGWCGGGERGHAGGRSPWPSCGPYGSRGDFGRDGLGWPGDRLPYPAYPLYGRFYGRYDQYERGGWFDPLLYGVREYDWGWYGPWQTYPGPLGWSNGAYGWYTATPWSRSPSECVDLTLLLANGRSHRLVIGLQSLGLADARDLDLAIDARLSAGEPVLLQGLDGRVLRIEPGTPIDDILIRPCGG